MSKHDLHSQYVQLINEMIHSVLKGKIRTEHQIYEWLVREIEVGTDVEFEAVLFDQILSTEAQLTDAIDDIKQAKAMRTSRALKLLNNQWNRYKESQRSNTVISGATQAILAAPADQRINEWIRVTDPNLDQPLDIDDLKHLVQSLNQFCQLNPGSEIELEQLVSGMHRGLESFQNLNGYLFEWMYTSQRQVGFTAELVENSGPWKLWAEHSHSTLLKQLFLTLSKQDSLLNWARSYPFDISDLVELSIVLRNIQRRLVAWFEQQPYDSKLGTQSAISTFLSLASVWCLLAQGMAEANRRNLEQNCFQLALQLLRRFCLRPYFPLYGGVLALLSGVYLQDTLRYLNEPLQQEKGTQAKARILTLLGYSYRIAGRYDLAAKFHQQALEIARSESDCPCEIANLNHLSRLEITQRNYAEALRYGQHALILSRQTDDPLGKTHALTNVGYAEIFSALTTNNNEPETLEMAMDWLKQGLKLSEALDTSTALGDVRQCRSLCQSSLGIAHVTLRQFDVAVPYLRKGLQFAQQAGDLYLQALNYSYLAHAYEGLSEDERSAVMIALGMYLFYQIGSLEWKDTAKFLLRLQEKMGQGELWLTISSNRSAIISLIGVDGYDELPILLREFDTN